MKISELVKSLLEIKEEYGDLECWYAEDDEGNGYTPISFDPTVMFKLWENEDDLCGKESLDEYIQDNINEFEFGESDPEYEPLKYETVVCVN